MNRWLWICPNLAVLLTITILFYWGWSWTSGGLIASVVVSLAAFIWIRFHARKQTDGTLKQDAKKSKGKSM